jgi:tetratricopeptide (TPR) repeat protein
MLSILFVIISLAGLATAAIIVLRHWGELAQLNVESIPGEQEAQKKREILTRRLEEESQATLTRLVQALGPLRAFGERVQTQFRRYVHQVEKLLRHEKTLKEKPASRRAAPANSEALQEQISRGEAALASSAAEAAEAAFITAIKINPKAAAAYRGLGQAYMMREQWDEAKQTYLFVTKLEPSDDRVYSLLGEIAEHQGNIEEAITYYQQAVLLNDSLAPRFYHLAELLVRVGQPTVAWEAIASALALEPKNPKHLDLAVETAILMNDKRAAERAYSDLRLVNPENQKLAEFKERIEKI